MDTDLQLECSHVTGVIVKRLLLLVAVLCAIGPSAATVANAAEPKALVIIDSYFDSRSGIEIVCLATDGCKSIVTKPPTSPSDNAHHGNAMAEIALRNIGSYKVIGLRMSVASAKTAADVTPADFIRAMAWIEKNIDRVGAVSFSRSMTGSGVCKLAAAGLAVAGYTVPAADQLIRTKIAALNARGIPFFAATGNRMNAPVNYPACIADVNSVATGNPTKTGGVASTTTWDANTDYFVDVSRSTYPSAMFKVLPMTTSPATAALAAKWLSTGSLVGRFQTVTT